MLGLTKSHDASSWPIQVPQMEDCYLPASRPQPHESLASQLAKSLVGRSNLRVMHFANAQRGRSRSKVSNDDLKKSGGKMFIYRCFQIFQGTHQSSTTRLRALLDECIPSYNHGVAWWLRRQTGDQEVAGSTPDSRVAAVCLCHQTV